MVYQAPLVVAGIVACKLWRNFAVGNFDSKGKTLPIYLHYFTWLYLILTGLFLCACKNMYFEVMAPDISNWLDPDTTEKNVKAVMAHDKETDVFTKWQDEASLRGFGPLIYFSLMSPLFVLGTLIVCIKHTAEHAQAVAAKPGGLSSRSGKLHDNAIFILALPCVYGLMSFKSVIRCWQITINHVGGAGASIFSGFEERKEFLDEMYEANFCVGDIYETLGLVAFGHLIMAVLETKVRQQMKLESSTPGGRSNRATLDELLRSMETVTVSGVKLFCASCMLQASYILVVTTIGFSLADWNIMPSYFSKTEGHLGLLQTPKTRSAVKIFFLGFGFAASSAAINNIMQIEGDFHGFLHGFSPSIKFWGTKVLVSLACLQSILLGIIPPFNSWQPLHVNLIYATMLCFECFLIAILHLKAWPCDEKWYDEDETNCEPLLHSEQD